MLQFDKDGEQLPLETTTVQWWQMSAEWFATNTLPTVVDVLFVAGAILLVLWMLRAMLRKPHGRNLKA
jgi:hypothetical protein